MSTSRIRHDAESRRRYETRTLGAFNLGVETNYEDWFITPEAAQVSPKKMTQTMLTLLSEIT